MQEPLADLSLRNEYMKTRLYSWPTDHLPDVRAVVDLLLQTTTFIKKIFLVIIKIDDWTTTKLTFFGIHSVAFKK